LLARQAQIAAKAGGVTSPPGGSFPTEPDNRMQQDPKNPSDAKAMNGKQDLKIQEQKHIESAVEPLKPVKSVSSVQSVQSVEPPIKSSVVSAPQNPDDVGFAPRNSTKGVDEVANPNAILELTKADIFKLLGMSQVAETEKKKNLDEMEETIWQDFVEEDLPKMLKPEEKGRFEDLLKTAPSAEKVINFFGSPPSGGLPADFEEKYLAKTLEFKAEIAKEQIETLLESVDDSSKKESLQKAKDLAAQGYWKQVEDLMVAAFG
jgi:hypothetical protein